MTRLTKIILSVFMMVEGVILIFGLPPFQKFDETVHFGRTMALSQGQLFCKDGHFEIPIVWDNLKHDYRFQKVLLENEKFPIDTVDFSKKWTEEELTQNSKIGGCGLNLLGYVPNTIGVWATSWTNRPAIVFYGGRVAGFVFLVTMLLWSLRIIDKKFQYLIWFYGLLPMVVHQATSFSYDVVIVSLILPLTALLVNKIIRKRTGWADISFWLIVTVMAVIKIVYVPLILVYIVFGWSKNKNGQAKNAVCNFEFFVLVADGWGGFADDEIGKIRQRLPSFY